MASIISPSTEGLKTSSVDKGHRIGNFHNYYTFNPPNARLDILKKSGLLKYVSSYFLSRQKLPKIKSNKKIKLEKDDAVVVPPQDDNINLFICDLGCNEGNLTMDICESLVKELNSKVAQDSSNIDADIDWNNITICMNNLGLDIDPILIERAEKKKCNNNRKDDSDSNTLSIHSRYTFQACDISTASQHRLCYESFLPTNDKHFDLTTVFSTTMWIHLHSGDEGLTEFLKRTCEFTNLLLIEPQPSKCYRNVNTRLRKMNLSEVDSVSKLSMRANIESKIEDVIVSCGFVRVELETLLEQHMPESGDEVLKINKTPWNRMLHLYKRLDCTTSL